MPGKISVHRVVVNQALLMLHRSLGASLSTPPSARQTSTDGCFGWPDFDLDVRKPQPTAGMQCANASVSPRSPSHRCWSPNLRLENDRQITDCSR
jgi:hypothetical protein